MRFSIFHVPTATGPEDDRNIIDLMIDQSLLADELGFAGIMLPEHHFTSYSVPGSDPMMFAAYLAPQLKQAFLGMAIIVAPIWNPVRMVERINLFDQLTRGNCIFGVGSGFHAVEFMGLGLSPNDPKSGLTDTHLELAERLWALKPGDEPVTYDDGHYKGTVIDRIMPQPYMGRRPPMMGTASSEHGTRRTAKAGWPIFFLQSGNHLELVKRARLYRKELVAAGHSKEVLAHCMNWSSTHTILTVVGDTDEEAMARAMVHLEGHGANHQRQYQWIAKAREVAGLPAEPPRFQSATGDYFVNKACIIGSPETVARRLQPWADLGIGLSNMSFNLGMPHDKFLRDSTEKSMRLFAKEVMPRFTGQTPPSDPMAIDLDAFEAGLGADLDIQVPV